MKASIFAGAVAYFAALAAALTTPVGEPQGNPFRTPGRGEIVDAGKPYTITWTPSSEGPISLVLLRGPSTNVVPLYTIVESIPNTGSYDWTPATTLEDDTTHYGIQLIEDSTGFYQYTDQFGVSNKDAVASSSTKGKGAVAPSTKVKEVVHTTSTPAAKTPKPTYAAEPTETMKEESISYSTHFATLTSCDCTETPTSYAVPTGTGYPDAVNETMYTAPGKSTPSNTVPPTPEYTGAGSQLKVGGAMVAVVAGMAFALF